MLNYLEQQYPLIFQYCQTYLKEIIYTTIIILVVVLYRWKFGYYYYYRKHNFTEAQIKRKRGGSNIPSFPNGWFKILSSWELKKGETKALKTCGREITIFRGQDGVAYAVDAYCGHMGAHLSQGKVKWQSCIQCPFHGWVYDGKTGKCVSSDQKEAKMVDKYQYTNDKIEKKNGKYLIKTCEKTETSIQSYHLSEKNGYIYLWVHSQNKAPEYYIPDIPKLRTRLTAGGECKSYLSCHVSEIPENGADCKHFEYVHAEFIKCLYPHVKFDWTTQMCVPTDPDFDERMRNHPDKKVRDFQNYILDQMLGNEQIKPYLNCLTVDSKLRFFNKFSIPLGYSTIFQMGPGVVYLFFNMHLFETVISMMVTPEEKSLVDLSNKVWSTWWVPNWLSAFILRFYLAQVYSDAPIWNKKVFKKDLCYNPKSDPDNILIKWRNWYGKYYEGCHEFEQNLNAYDW